MEHVLWRLVVSSTMRGYSVCLADPLEVGSQTTVFCSQAEDALLLFSVKLTYLEHPGLVESLCVQGSPSVSLEPVHLNAQLNYILCTVQLYQ